MEGVPREIFIAHDRLVTVVLQRLFHTIQVVFELGFGRLPRSVEEPFTVVGVHASDDREVAPAGWTGDGRVLFVEGDVVVEHGGDVGVGTDESVEGDTTCRESAVSARCVDERVH